MVTEETVRSHLKNVYDPEISINVNDLGLIYEVTVDGSHVHVKHTLTSMMCPFAEEICEDIYYTTVNIEGVDSVERELVFDPPFGIEMIPEQTRLLLDL
jgi:metal-sulfur cluster biosynthetic enzyme